jgi:hAT family C-terminal dimerisation region
LSGEFFIHFTYLNIQVAIQLKSTASKNIFDNIPALLAPKASDLRSELEQYLNMDPEDVTDVLLWWYEQKHICPCLHCMALDYFSIPREFD